MADRHATAQLANDATAPGRRFGLVAGDDTFLAVGDDGWAYWHIPGEPDLRARLNLDGLRITFSAVAIQARPVEAAALGSVRPADMRGFPIGRLESLVNEPRLAAAIRAALTAPPSGLRLAPDEYLDLARLEALPLVEAPELDYRIRGIDDPGRRHPDVLLTDVAQAWAAASATGARNPAAVIAKANGVNMASVHAWIKAARRAGVMAPSSRGNNAGLRHATDDDGTTTLRPQDNRPSQ